VLPLLEFDPEQRLAYERFKSLFRLFSGYSPMSLCRDSSDSHVVKIAIYLAKD
jgi:hypothetical protein